MEASNMNKLSAKARISVEIECAVVVKNVVAFIQPTSEAMRMLSQPSRDSILSQIPNAYTEVVELVLREV